MDSLARSKSTTASSWSRPTVRSAASSSKFFAAVTGAEVTGPIFTPDNTALFVAIQHPGEGGTFEEPITNFPDGGTTGPRPSIVVITKDDGGVIGS